MDNFARFIGSWTPHLWGLAFIAILLVIQFLINPKKLKGWLRFLGFCVGENNRLSISKFQIWLWTHVALWSFIALFVRAAMYAIGKPEVDITRLVPGLDSEILVIMGYSSLIAIGAKAVVVNQINQGRREDRRYPEDPILTDLFLNAERTAVQLHNLQLFAWTLLATILYVYRVHLQLFSIANELPGLLSYATAANTAAVSAGAATQETIGKLAELAALVKMPSIGAELLLLMGISQTAYIGGKLVTGPDKPLVVISEVTQHTEAGKARARVTIANLSLKPQSIAAWKLQVKRKEAGRGSEESYSFPEGTELKGQEGKTIEFSENGADLKLGAPLSAGDEIVLLDAAGIEVNRKKVTEEDLAG